MKSLTGNLIILVLAFSLGFVVWRQIKANTALHAEQTRLREQSVELTRLQAAQNFFKNAAASSSELEEIQSEAEESARLRNRIEEMTKTPARMAAPKTAPAVVQKKREDVWRNDGQATPVDTLHSVLWAATNGDVESLTPMLAFDPASRSEADAMLASLSDSVRAQYPTVEKLVATMISSRLATDFNLANPLEQTDEGLDRRSVKFELQKASSARKEVIFHFQRNGSEWRLLVPQTAIAVFKRSLEARWYHVTILYSY